MLPQIFVPLSRAVAGVLFIGLASRRAE